ncbi:Uncharacterised protein [Candidatus Bilamarchaeum dharawalense]|uniref:Methyltransferase type 11 domain-containing protein n=1 Tax=Candidatus Bilamarchaeum dharawalense TaxID=2885759 RepID=A0A5E4LVF0_9ARCH|nr:Uncharacterised protein [Candidatus Bilamarchaeum dharawalense]
MVNANRQFVEVKTRLIKMELPKGLRDLVLSDRYMPKPVTPVVVEIPETRKDWVWASALSAFNAAMHGDPEAADRLARKVLRFEHTPGLDFYGNSSMQSGATGLWGQYACNSWQFGDIREFHEISLRVSSLVHGPSIDLASGKSEYYTPDVAVDGSKAMLLRNAALVRLLGNLNSVSSGARLPFSSHFRTVTMLLGEKYLDNPASVYAEAYRVMDPGGSIFLVEGQRAYPLLKKRNHDPLRIKAELHEAGFTGVVCADICDGAFQLFRGRKFVY